MKILELKVQNYRTLEDVKLKFSESFTAICGPNDCGKTNIIRVIRALMRDHEPYYYREVEELSAKDNYPKWKHSESGEKTIRLSLMQQKVVMGQARLNACPPSRYFGATSSCRLASPLHQHFPHIHRLHPGGTNRLHPKVGVFVGAAGFRVHANQARGFEKNIRRAFLSFNRLATPNSAGYSPLMIATEIEQMTIAERIQAMELLWRSISAQPENVVSPDWHGEVLKKRLAKIESGKAEFLSVAQLKKRLAKRNR